MNINFELYKIFYYVGEYKSITKTANYLNVSQPAITKHIKNLESFLSVKLIEKIPNGIELTNDGKALHEKIKNHIEELLKIEHEYNEKEQNNEYTIRIIAGNSMLQIFLRDKIIEYNKKHPNIKIKIDAGRHLEAIKKLHDGEADIVFINKKSNLKQYEEFIIKNCYTTNDILVVNNDVKEQYPSLIHIKDINKYPIIYIPTETAAKTKINEILAKKNDVFKPKYEVSQENITVEYVKNNLGIGFVSKEIVKRELEKNEFSKIDLDIELPKREICYAIRKNSAGYKYLQEFIKELNS